MTTAPSPASGRPGPPRSRLASGLWTCWLLVLGALWASAWLWPDWHHHLARWLQGRYHVPFATSPWYLRGNAPLHACAALQAALCLVSGMRLWLPRWPAWWGFATAAGLCFADELAQHWSHLRGFDPRDWESDAAGLAVALVVILVWRIPLRGPDADQR